MRGRHKRRGFKADGVTLGMDMYPYCYSFGCDPMAMSPAFQQKIDDRLRQGLCPCCGEPKAFCRCKSNGMIAPGTHAIRTHNNKKRRAAREAVKRKEEAYQAWRRYEGILSSVLGETAYVDARWSLREHQVPSLPWERVAQCLEETGLDPELFAPGWDK